MSMETPEKPFIAAPLANRVRADATASQVAEAVASIWLEIDAALTPIVGQRGLVALYRRSLYVAATTHPWLDGLQEGMHASMDLAGIRSAFARQTGAAAVAGGCDLFRAFHDLLESMVGPSLTERLLRPVWALSPHGPAAHAQDTTS